MSPLPDKTKRLRPPRPATYGRSSRSSSTSFKVFRDAVRDSNEITLRKKARVKLPGSNPNMAEHPRLRPGLRLCNADDDDNEDPFADPPAEPARKPALVEKPVNRPAFRKPPSTPAGLSGMIYTSDSPFKIHRYRPTEEDREFPYLLSASGGSGEAPAGHKRYRDRAKEGYPSLCSDEKKEESKGNNKPLSTSDYETGYGTDGDSSPSRNPFYSPEDRMVSEEAQERSLSLYSNKERGRKSRGDRSLAGDCETRYVTGGDSSPSRNPFFSPEDREVSGEAQKSLPPLYPTKKKGNGSMGGRPLATADCETRYGTGGDSSLSRNPFYSPEDRLVSHGAEGEGHSTNPFANSMPKRKAWQQPRKYEVRGQEGRPANSEKVPAKTAKGIPWGARGMRDGVTRDHYTARGTGEAGGTDDEVDELQMDLPGTRI